MKASQVHLLSFLRSPGQFVIPIYQRAYSWDDRQCRQLLADILAAGRAPADHTHFVGSIVYFKTEAYLHGGLQQLLVIDGQQRLTTLLLLIRALADLAADRGLSGDLAPSKLVNYYLVNNEETGALRYRLRLGPADRRALQQVVNGTTPDDAGSRVGHNYQLLRTLLASGGHSLDEVYRGLVRLTAVEISLEHGKDDPQLIYESLNSTGLDLTQADLVRNYVLMKLPPENHEEVYERYWRPMDAAFRDAPAGVFDRFMREYLTLRTGTVPRLDRVYEAFKVYARACTGDDLTALLGDLHQSANYYARMSLGKEPDSVLAKHFKRIKALNTDIVYLLLLRVYGDYAAGAMDRAEFVAVVEMMESFILRRSICAIPTNALDKLFAIVNTEIQLERYVESLQAALLRQTDRRRFPSDEEFHAALQTWDCYTSRNSLYVLDRLENHDRKEYADPRDYTIEHIMPQNPNLGPEWRRALGENWRSIQRAYLHTLGNITLTGYNPELSDRPFAVKQSMEGGFRHSPLRLNAGLGELADWNEAEIRARGQRLADLAVQVWPRPVLDADTLASYTPPEPPKSVYTLDSYPAMDGPIGPLVRELDARLLSRFAGLRCEPLKLYIAYKLHTNVVDVQVQKKSAKLFLNMPFDVIDDPLGLCRDVRNIGRNGNGEIQIHLTSAAQLDEVMDLIQQSYDYHLRNT